MSKRRVGVTATESLSKLADQAVELLNALGIHCELLSAEGDRLTQVNVILSNSSDAYADVIQLCEKANERGISEGPGNVAFLLFKFDGTKASAAAEPEETAESDLEAKIHELHLPLVQSAVVVTDHLAALEELVYPGVVGELRKSSKSLSALSSADVKAVLSQVLSSEAKFSVPGETVQYTEFLDPISEQTPGDEEKDVLSVKLSALMLGAPGSGKTSLVCRYFHNDSPDEVEPTHAASFSMKSFRVEQGTIDLQVWDTSCEEKYLGMIPIYSRNCEIVIVTIDATDPNWMQRTLCIVENEHIDLKNLQLPVIIALTKVDKLTPEEFGELRTQVETLATEYEARVMSVSALVNKNIDAFFHFVVTLAASTKLRRMVQSLHKVIEDEDEVKRLFFLMKFWDPDSVPERFKSLDISDWAGHLFKRGKLNTSFKRRYFKLRCDEDCHVLTYYKKELDKKPAGAIDLVGAVIRWGGGHVDGLANISQRDKDFAIRKRLLLIDTAADNRNWRLQTDSARDAQYLSTYFRLGAYLRHRLSRAREARVASNTDVNDFVLPPTTFGK